MARFGLRLITIAELITLLGLVYFQIGDTNLMFIMIGVLFGMLYTDIGKELLELKFTEYFKESE